MILRAGYLALAIHMQESACDMSSNEMRDKLQNAITAAHKGTNQNPQYVDHTGDEDSGTCVFSCDPDGDGDTDYVQAPYSKGTDSSDDDLSIDKSKGKQVAMRSSWDELPDDADGYAAMSEAMVTAKLYRAMPIYERFVSKKERDAASSGDFAGKGKSYPILKAKDVGDGLQALGRAGPHNHSVSTIRANIIKIAKAKGFPLPASAQDSGDGSAKESAVLGGQSGALKLVESAATLEPIV